MIYLYFIWNLFSFYICLYDYWKILAERNFIDTAKVIGRKGRDLYLKKYKFEKMVENRLLPLLD